MSDSHYEQLTFNFNGFRSHRNLESGLFGILTPGDSIDLGTDIDVLMLARRAKAVDKAINLTTYDQRSAEFQRIADHCHATDGCFAGMSFLLYEHSSGEFLEWFCSSKLAKKAMGTGIGFAHRAQVSPNPLGTQLNILSQLEHDRNFCWHVPVPHLSDNPFTARPSDDEIAHEVERFTSEKAHV